MQKIIAGCAVLIILFCLFFYGYATAFLLRIEPEWLAYIFAGVGALMLLLLVGSVKTLFQTRTTVAALRRIRNNHLSKDEKLTEIQSMVESIGETINFSFLVHSVCLTNID